MFSTSTSDEKNFPTDRLIAIASFSRSNSSREPSFFTTARLGRSIRSYVVKRCLPSSVSLRRRIVAPSADSRDSITRLSPILILYFDTTKVTPRLMSYFSCDGGGMPEYQTHRLLLAVYSKYRDAYHQQTPRRLLIDPNLSRPIQLHRLLLRP